MIAASRGSSLRPPTRRAELDAAVRHQRRGPRGSDLRLSVYNGLDCCITREILPVLQAQLDEVSARSYGFSLQCLGPALDMMSRGIQGRWLRAPSGSRRAKPRRRDRYEGWLDKIGLVIWGKPLNPRSHVQLKKFFYEVMGSARAASL